MFSERRLGFFIFRAWGPVVLYGVLWGIRNHWSWTGCHVSPDRCLSLPLVPGDAFWLPQLWQYPWADRISTGFQNGAGGLALLGLGWGVWKTLQTETVRKAQQLGIQGLFTFFQVTFWNAVGVEMARLLFPRLRPYAFVEPEKIPSLVDYSSFYSGHTSFAAAAMTFFVLQLSLVSPFSSRKGLKVLLFCFAGGWVGITAGLRILALKHFPSDVIGGALAGCLVALFLSRSRLQSAS